METWSGKRPSPPGMSWEKTALRPSFTPKQCSWQRSHSPSWESDPTWWVSLHDGEMGPCQPFPLATQDGDVALCAHRYHAWQAVRIPSSRRTSALVMSSIRGCCGGTQRTGERWFSMNTTRLEYFGRQRPCFGGFTLLSYKEQNAVGKSASFVRKNSHNRWDSCWVPIVTVQYF